MFKRLVIWPKETVVKAYLALSRVKVIYQILIIILIMILFLGIQGYMAIKIINTMQNTTFVSFEKNSGLTGNIFKAELDLELLHNNYLSFLTGHVDALNSEEYLNRFAFRVSTVENIDKKTVETILKEWQTTREILSAPVNEENYQRLKKNLYSVYFQIRILENSMSDHAFASFSSSKEYTVKSRSNTSFIMFLSAAIALLLGSALTSFIVRPLNAAKKAAQALAIGQLTENIQVAGCPEVKGVVDGLNKAVSGLQRLVQGINRQAETLFSHSTELMDASNETSRATSQVAKAMEELAKAASAQVEQISEAVETVNLLSNLVKRVTSDTENIAVSSQKVAESARLGQQVTVDIKNEINELFQATREVAEVIESLNKTSGEINDITSVIGGIAEQTTLLALNASIEAARAGEHGRGFSVVADETGKLAEQSKQAALMIDNLVAQMKVRNTQAEEIINKGLQKVEAGQELTSEAARTFGEIFRTLLDNIDQITAVARSARQMLTSNEEVSRKISSIAMFSEESLVSTEQVSATAQEQNAAVEEVAALAENLAKIAGELEKAVAVFKMG